MATFAGKYEVKKEIHVVSPDVSLTFSGMSGAHVCTPVHIS